MDPFQTIGLFRCGLGSLLDDADHVDDEEELYRRVPEAAGSACYYIDHGKVVFFSSAFNDVSQSPSVDRANKRQFDPHRTRLRQQDGIVALEAGAIRGLGPIIQRDQRGRQVSQHSVDVVYDPIFGNCAHALVSAEPTITSGSAFKRLKDGLVRLANQAGWRVEPGIPVPPRKAREILQEALQCFVQRLREILLPNR